MMKFLTAKYENKEFIGLLTDSNTILDLNKASMDVGIRLPVSLLSAIELGSEFLDKVQSIITAIDCLDSNKNTYKIDDSKLKFLAPIPRPTKNILCVGKNYKEHVIEMGSVEDIPDHPMIFTKAPTSVIGHEENILLHEGVTDALDYEGELAVVIGKQGKGIKKEDAYDYIFGYTILNDVTARDLQSKHKQFFLGKSLDASCPIGPTIVHKSVVENPHQLSLTTKVNDEVRQDGFTGDMIFNIPTLIAVLSKGMTLEPGDIIATGTPSGVGKGFKPPRFLKRGDKIEITIEEIGTLRNVVL
jgi:2-keto-4-pentenoate hydratase/2-oxohepta-3-ene-1,7-dioic acid hydratase in catechol pathway